MLTDKLREFFSTFGIPEEIATDGGLTYTSYETQQFLRDYGVRHRLSSVAFAQSNKRAELAVKSMKRLLRENTNHDGSLNNGRYLRALMAYRNTPDQDTKMSPAQVVFGRQLRDFLPAPHTRYKPDPGWVKMKNEREKLMAKRALANMERRAIGCRTLPKLAVGKHVMMQNQDGNNPRSWDHTGRVVEVRDNDQYVIKTDGSNRLSLRNRKFLRGITPYEHVMMRPANPAKVQEERIREERILSPPRQVQVPMQEERDREERILSPSGQTEAPVPARAAEPVPVPAAAPTPEPVEAPRYPTRVRGPPPRLNISTNKGQSYDEPRMNSIVAQVSSPDKSTGTISCPWSSGRRRGIHNGDAAAART